MALSSVALQSKIQRRERSLCRVVLNPEPESKPSLVGPYHRPL